MNFTDLRKIDIGSRVDTKWSQERIPSVSEILQLCKGRIGVYLDVKDASIESLATLVKQCDCDLGHDSVDTECILGADGNGNHGWIVCRNVLNVDQFACALRHSVSREAAGR